MYIRTQISGVQFDQDTVVQDAIVCHYLAYLVIDGLTIIWCYLMSMSAGAAFLYGILSMYFLTACNLTFLVDIFSLSVISKNFPKFSRASAMQIQSFSNYGNIKILTSLSKFSPLFSIVEDTLSTVTIFFFTNR